MRSKAIPFLVAIMLPFIGYASSLHYSEVNQAKVSFDVSHPIDATGYTLQGHHLTGGSIEFFDHGTYINQSLSHETGQFELPTVTTLANKPLIKTNVNYTAIKFINPTGINNLFIKIGTATRTQKVSGLDPQVLKNGTYTWKVPFFTFGKESNTVNHKRRNIQFIQVGSTGGPASNNVMYTQDFYLYSEGKGNTAISGHPISHIRSSDVLSKAHVDYFNCRADGLWGAGGADPYRTLKGHCKGFATVFPAGPNLGYEYGVFTLPTVHTPWTASSRDHCMMKGKRHSGCIAAKISLSIRYMAQKIRVPINHNISVFAEFGTAYRHIIPTNLRYQCKTNVYLKKILPKSACLKKNYLPGGSVYTYFAVGYEIKANDGKRYSARYINIPGQENANRLTWNDASDTQLYAIGFPSKKTVNKETLKAIRKKFNAALEVIRKEPKIYKILGKHFFVKILKKNSLYTYRE
jgi:hypothetical protein